MKPKLCIFHDPTGGIDVGAKKASFERIQRFADGGGEVIIRSDEWADLAHLCDRVGIVKSGRVVEFLSGATCTEHHIAERCNRVAADGLAAERR